MNPIDKHSHENYHCQRINNGCSLFEILNDWITLLLYSMLCILVNKLKFYLNIKIFQVNINLFHFSRLQKTINIFKIFNYNDTLTIRVFNGLLFFGRFWNDFYFFAAKQTDFLATIVEHFQTEWKVFAFIRIRYEQSFSCAEILYNN